MNDMHVVKVKFSNYFPALKSRSFRYFWIGQCISLTGTWMQTTAQSWLVFSLTNSSFLLGLSVAISSIPLLLLSPFAGILIDRFSEKRVLLFTQTVFMIMSLIISGLVWSGGISYWHMLVFSFVSGAVNAVNFPTRQTFIYELVGKEDLVNGIALNSIVFNAARIIGPVLAGLLMGYAGAAICFFINGLCFIPVNYWIYKIKINEKKYKNSYDVNVFGDIKGAMVYIKKKNVLYITLLVSTMVGMLAMNYNVLTPVLVRDVLNKGAEGYAFLLSCMGVGSLIGAVYMAIKSKKNFNLKFILALPISISFLFLLIGNIRNNYVIEIIYTFYGFCITVFSTASNTTIMLNSEDEIRARVVSIYTLLFIGTNPMGGILVGALAERFGISVCFIMLASVICLLTVLLSKAVKKQQHSEILNSNWNS